MSENVVFEDFMESSVCKGCKYLLFRAVLPENYEDFGIDIDEVESKIGDDTSVLVLHYYCTKANIDVLDLVLECNRFEKELDISRSILTKDPYK